MSLAAGTYLAHYEILSLLGAGGMGEVYRARDTKLEREVAIKVLPEAMTLDADRLARFVREARVIASINEPGIVTVHAIEGTGPAADGSGSCRFIVTELIEGRELAAVVPPDGLPLRDFIDLGVQLVRAIGAAHRGGILHRDIKPANVMVTVSGRIKVLDFGVAKFLANPEGTIQGQPTQELTQAGTVIGTVPYMSPEQIKGAELDERSDLFSTGIVLYEMATGRRPFAGDNAPMLMSSILRDEPAPASTLRAQLPRQLDRILRHCLEKDPARRYRGAEDLLYDLEALGDEITREPRAPTVAPSPASTIGQGVAAPSAPATSSAPSPSTPPSASSVLSAPTAPTAPIEQHIRFCTTTDGVSLAYATAGQGSPLVRSLGWFTHLEMEWEWPEGRQFWERLARRHLLVRYDGRGMGLSESSVDALGQAQRLIDLEAVVDAAGLERFALMGMSEGGQTAISYAARHPERVSHLVLYGTFADNSHLLADTERDKWRGLAQLMKTGWGQDTPVFRQIFTHLFLGTAVDADQIRYFDEIQRASASPETAVAFLRATGRVEVAEEARRIRCPTLVVHRRGDLLVPFAAGRKVAALIPGARFLPMEGDNHWLLLRDPGVEAYAEALERFLSESSGGNG